MGLEMRITSHLIPVSPEMLHHNRDAWNTGYVCSTNKIHTVIYRRSKHSYLFLPLPSSCVVSCHQEWKLTSELCYLVCLMCTTSPWMFLCYGQMFLCLRAVEKVMEGKLFEVEFEYTSAALKTAQALWEWWRKSSSNMEVVNAFSHIFLMYTWMLVFPATGLLYESRKRECVALTIVCNLLTPMSRIGKNSFLLL